MPLNLSNLLCIRFEFGLPLEDIFPPDDIHPRLHNLFYQTTLAVNDAYVPLYLLLRKCELSLNEAFELKNALINGKLRYREGVSPSSFLWLIRHFLGLLPLPLFPTFTNNVKYNWEYLATQCQLIEMEPNLQLVSDISLCIHKLPKANITLIYAFIKFLRKICLKAPKRLSRESVVAVTTYFSSSIFFRPYRPGTVTRTDKLYYPLLCYIIVNWNKIRKHKIVEDNLSSIWEYEEPTSGHSKDCGCQTSSVDIESHISIKTEREESTQTEQQVMDQSKTYKDCGVNTIKQNTEEKHCDDSQDDQLSDITTTNSETIIHKNENELLSPKVNLRRKISKASRSLVNVVSKVNGKIKSKQGVLKSRSGPKLDTCKYRVLKESNPGKTQSLHASHCVKDSPNIKYKKLMTL